MRLMGLVFCLAIFVYNALALANSCGTCRKGFCGPCQPRRVPEPPPQVVDFFPNGRFIQNPLQGIDSNANQVFIDGNGRLQSFPSASNAQLNSLDNGVGFSGAASPVDLSLAANGQGAGVPFQGQGVVGSANGLQALHGVQGGNAFQSGGRWIVNSQFPSNVQVLDQTARVFTGQQIVLDPFTGLPIRAFNGMLILDAMVNGQRAFVPVPQGAANNILNGYIEFFQRGGVDPVRQSILEAYQRVQGQFGQSSQFADSNQPAENSLPTAPSLGGNSGGNPSATQPPSVEQNPQGGGQASSQASSKPSSQLSEQSLAPLPPSEEGATHNNNNLPVQTTNRPTSNEPAVVKNQHYDKWMKRYEEAQPEGEDWATKISEKLKEGATKLEKYSVLPIHFRCASPEGEDQDMTLFAFTSKDLDGNEQTHFAVYDEKFDSVKASELAPEAWKRAKASEGDRDRGIAKPRTAALALGNNFAITDEGLKEAGFSQVQVKLRTEANGKFILNQLVKTAEDVTNGEWSSSKNDWNLFCVMPDAPAPQEPTKTEPPAEQQNHNQGNPASNANLQSAFGKCIDCHDSTSNHNFIVKEEGGKFSTFLKFGGFNKGEIAQIVKDSMAEKAGLTPQEIDAIVAWDK